MSYPDVVEWRNTPIDKPFPVPESCNCSLRDLPREMQGYPGDPLNHDSTCKYRYRGNGAS